MEIAELKKKLIDEINATSQVDALEDFYQFLKDKNTGSYILNEDQLSAVKESKSQIKEGRFLTHEKANEEIKKWLEK